MKEEKEVGGRKSYNDQKRLIKGCFNYIFEELVRKLNKYFSRFKFGKAEDIKLFSLLKR